MTVNTSPGRRRASPATWRWTSLVAALTVAAGVFAFMFSAASAHGPPNLAADVSCSLVLATLFGGVTWAAVLIMTARRKR